MQESVNFIDLKREIQQGLPLVLFLGAGVSAEFVPTWQILLSNLVERAIQLGLSSSEGKDRCAIKKILTDQEGKLKLSPYEKAGMAKRLLGNRHYIPELHDCMYKNMRPDWLKGIDRTLLGPVVSLCQLKSVIAIVTYNFDDLPDIAMKEKGKRAIHSVYGRKQPWIVHEKLPIYHVHGFVPYMGARIPEEEALVILSQEEYFQTMLEPLSWQTITQLYFLRNYICLLLGTSVTDLNMLRILSHAKYFLEGAGRTFVLTCYDSIIADKECVQNPQERDYIMRIWATLLEEVNVKMILTGESYRSISEHVEELKDLMTGINEKAKGV